MKPDEIIFNDNLEMSLSLEGMVQKITLILSDDLLASKEVLTIEYKRKIVNFINNIHNWYDKVNNSVKKRAQDLYHVEAKDEEIQLMSIFILFEQNEDELFGLGFRTEFDIEHGCGLKIIGKNYIITEIGTWDVAFG